MSDLMLATVAGLASAAVLEVLRHLLGRMQKMTEKRIDDATSFRHDLLARITALENDLVQITKQGDNWQERYYAERELRLKAQWQLENRGQLLEMPPAIQKAGDCLLDIAPSDAQTSASLVPAFQADPKSEVENALTEPKNG